MPSTVGESGYPIKVDSTSDRFRLDFCMFIVEFYRGATGYNKIYNRLGKVQVYDERIFLEYKSGNQWKQRGTPKDVVLTKINDNHYEVTRTYDDSLGTTYDVTYTVKSDQPIKITVTVKSGQKDEYRLAWQLSGIVDPNTNSTLAENTSKVNCVYFGDDREGSRNYICFDWKDIFEKLGAITETSYSDAAKGRKASITFNIGVINAGETKKIDPSTVGTSTGSDATMWSFQRKGFHAVGRFWSFYSDNTNHVFRTSTDGSTWSAATIARANAWSGSGFSVCLEGPNIVHYAYCYFDSNNPIMYRKGTLNSDGTISWIAAEQIALAAASGVTYPYPTIAVDSGGYPWIGYRRVEGSAYPYVTKSSTNDGTWTDASGFPYQLSTHADTSWCIVPIVLTSSRVYVAYFEHADVNYMKGKLWDGAAWGSEEIANPTGGMQDSKYASWVANGDDVYAVWLRGTQVIYCNKRTYGVGWGSMETVQAAVSTTSAPVLSANTVTGEIFCFWALSPTANHIYYKKRTSGGTWDTDPTDWIDESTDGLTGYDRLTCFYQAYSGHIGLMYMTLAGSPYNVRFAFLTLAQTYYQSLPATEVSVAVFIRNIGKGMAVSEASLPSLARTATFYRMLAGIASGVATLGKTATHFLALTVAEVSSTILTKLATFYRSLSATEIGAPSLTRIITYLRALSVTEVSSATLTKMIHKTLSIMETSIATLAETTTHFVALAALEVAALSLLLSKTFYRALSTVATSITQLAKIATHFLTLTASTSGLTSIARTVSKTLSAAALGIARLGSKATHFLALAIIAVSSVTLSRTATFFRSLSVVEVSVPSLTKLILKFLTVVENSIVTLSKIGTHFVLLACVAVASSSFSKKISKSLSAVAASLASLGGFIRSLLRTFLVPKESRVLKVAAEDRRMLVPPEDRKVKA